MSNTNNQALLCLRSWQKEALDAFQTNASSNFLAVATPGAGKTTFALVAARLTMPNLPGRLCIVAPTKHLKRQWLEAAERFGISLLPDWSAGEKLPLDVHGVIATYQQVGLAPESFFDLTQGGFVILDEVHHAGDEKSWGDGVTNGFAAAARRLCLSGTPFRSDTNRIPFVRYEDDLANPDYEYDYSKALEETTVVRPVYFPRFGGTMEWTSSGGETMAASFADPLERSSANQRLRAALSLHGDWLPTVLGEANEQLQRIRRTHKDAGGLVIASDQEHARGIIKLLRERYGVAADLAISEDAGSNRTISRFRDGNKPWLVAVRMVSEGVDIPRLRVGVYATNTATELFFRQAVGRIVRYVPGIGPQKSFMFIPDDSRLRHYANEVAESRRHSLKKRRTDEQARSTEGLEDQLSLFEVHSSVATESEANLSLFDADDESRDADIIDVEPSESENPELLIDLLSLPKLDSAGLPNAQVADSGHEHAAGMPGGQLERERLRRINKDLAKELATLTNSEHSLINLELNRRAGIKTISEATVIQLNRRSREAERWLRHEQRRKKFTG